MKRTVRPVSLLISLCLCICLLLPAALSLASCSGEPAAECRVVSVTLDGGKIKAEAVLTEGFLDGYEGKSVYLFELPSLYSTDVDLDELDPVAEAKPRARVSFTLDVSDGARSRLYSSYLVASYDSETRRYTPLTRPTALSNPEAMAEYDPPAAPAAASIKGLISDHPADAIRLGISHTVVDVYMDKLILAGWREGAVSYVYGGVTRYLDGDTLAELDQTVGLYTAAGVEVYLRFILGNSADTPLGLYYAPDRSAVSNIRDFAVNMSTAFSAGIMEGFFDLMADRYASPDDGSLPVSAFVVGYRVNDSAVHNYAGGADLAAYVTNYEKLTRAAHTAIKSHNPLGRVYISLDSRRAVGSDEQGWDVPAFLSAFRDECALRGDYDWHVACELYADTSAVWEESTAVDGKRYTVHNLNTLTDLLDGEAYRTPAGESRRLLVSGFAIPAVTAGGTPSESDSAKQAASYAYAYMTCVKNGGVEALIYSVHTDPAPTAEAGPLCGLWTVKLDTTLTESGLDLTVRPAAARPIWDVFKAVDTDGISELSGALAEIAGPSYTKLEGALAGKASPVTVLNGKATLGSYDADRKGVTPLYTFDRGSLHGFANAGGLTYCELSEAETLGKVTLYARFDRSSVCDPMGLTVTLPATDLIGAKELIFDLYAGQIASADSSVKPTVTLRLTRPAQGSAADGSGELRYEADVTEVKGSTWQTAVFEIKDFTALLDASDEVILTLSMDYPPHAAPDGHTAHNLGLAGVYISGATAASGTPAALVVTVVAVLILLVAGVFVFLLLRHRSRAGKKVS